MKSSITKYLVGGAIVAIIAAYAIFSADNKSGNAVAMLPTIPSSSSSSPSSSSPTGSTSAGFPAQTGAARTGRYKDGTYTGPVADAFYGPLQVSVTIQGGAITNVTYPQYPNDPGHTTEVSQSSLPVLTQEAIADQNANVDIVSGATQTSQAFQQSLAAALASASE